MDRKHILAAISECKRKEEVLWWQRAHTDHLKYGDSNTRWFHSRASMRRAKNHIDGLVDDANRMCTEPEEIGFLILYEWQSGDVGSP